jgi:hypothetical protein
VLLRSTKATETRKRIDGLKSVKRDGEGSEHPLVDYTKKKELAPINGHSCSVTLANEHFVPRTDKKGTIANFSNFFFARDRVSFFSQTLSPFFLFAHAQCPTTPVLLRNNSYIVISNCHQDFMFEEVSPFIPIANLTLEVRHSTIMRVFFIYYPTLNFVLLAVNSSMQRASVIVNATHRNFVLRGENSVFRPFGTEGSVVVQGPNAVQLVDSSIVFVNCTINLVQQQLFVSYAPVIGFVASFVNTKLYIEGTSSSLDWAVIDLTHSVTRATSMFRQILVNASNSTFETKGANRKYILMRVVSPTRTSVVGQVHRTDDIVVDMTTGAVRCLVSWSRLISVTSQQHPSPLRGAVHHMKNITVLLRDVIVDNLRDALILLEPYHIRAHASNGGSVHVEQEIL